MAEVSYIQSLMNLCAKGKAQLPEFTLIEDGTREKKPQFKYQVALTLQKVYIKIIGTGSSKKKAKQESAWLALEKLSEMNILQSVLEAIRLEQEISPKINYNAVRQLRKFCKEKYILKPKYNLVAATGPLTAMDYTIECSVYMHKETGMASTKKMAKRFAADRMLKKLKEIDQID